MPGSQVVHCAQAIGGRMPPVLRNSGGPEGRQETSLPPPGFSKPSPHEAGIEIECMNYRVRAAGRGVDAPCLRDATKTLRIAASAEGEHPHLPDHIAALRAAAQRPSVTRCSLC